MFVHRSGIILSNERLAQKSGYLHLVIGDKIVVMSKIIDIDVVKLYYLFKVNIDSHLAEFRREFPAKIFKLRSSSHNCTKLIQLNR